jgi:hypothetical protein
MHCMLVHVATHACSLCCIVNLSRMLFSELAMYCMLVHVAAQVRGLCRSDDLSRMLPSEMAMMAHGWPRKAQVEAGARCVCVFRVRVC